MRSVLRQGHRLALYCYGDVAGVPDEVEVRDASAVLPRSAIPASWGNRSDLYSDWFRYELQRRGLGTWLDLDVYLVAPLDFSRPYLFGELEPGTINGAVLRLPPDAPILAALLEQFEKEVFPTWLSWRWKGPALLRKLITGQQELSRTPWGTTGPHALTAFVPRFGLSSEVLPPAVFYPVAWRNAGWITDPAVRLKDVIEERTVGVHLWNECIKRIKDSKPPAGSFLERLHDEGAV